MSQAPDFLIRLSATEPRGIRQARIVGGMRIHGSRSGLLLSHNAPIFLFDPEPEEVKGFILVLPVNGSALAINSETKWPIQVECFGLLSPDATGMDLIPEEFCVRKGTAILYPPGKAGEDIAREEFARDPTIQPLLDRGKKIVGTGSPQLPATITGELRDGAATNERRVVRLIVDVFFEIDGYPAEPPSTPEWEQATISVSQRANVPYPLLNDSVLEFVSPAGDTLELEVYNPRNQTTSDIARSVIVVDTWDNYIGTISRLITEFGFSPPAYLSDEEYFWETPG